jgi:aspartate/methionine/tyrosine aminotransferase
LSCDARVRTSSTSASATPTSPRRRRGGQAVEAAAKPHNHRYSASRGIPKLRSAICDLYRDRFGVELDPETQAVATIGAKEDSPI